MDFLENYELTDEVLEEMNLDELFPELLETIKSLPAPAQETLAEMLDKYPIEEALAKFFDVDDDIDDTFAGSFCYSNPVPILRLNRFLTTVPVITSVLTRMVIFMLRTHLHGGSRI